MSWAIHTFTVTTLGEEFAKGLSSMRGKRTFPMLGQGHEIWKKREGQSLKPELSICQAFKGS